jgi:hypothetical protein
VVPDPNAPASSPTTAPAGQTPDPAAPPTQNATPDGQTPGLGGERVGSSAPVRVDNGSLHTPWASHDSLATTPSADSAIPGLAADTGHTPQQLTDMIYHTPVTSLSPADAQVVIDVRTNLGSPAPGTTMQKIYSADDAIKLLDGTYAPNQVGGFVAAAPDTVALKTADQVFHGLGLDYAGNPFQRADGTVGEVFAVRFELDAPTAATLGVPMGPLEVQAGLPVTYDAGVGAPGGGNPFLGNGFVGKGGDAVIPEIHLPNRTVIGDRSEMYRIGADGSEQLFAVLINGAWQLVS